MNTAGSNGQAAVPRLTQNAGGEKEANGSANLTSRNHCLLGKRRQPKEMAAATN